MANIESKIDEYYEEKIGIDLNPGLQRVVDEYIRELKEEIVALIKSCDEAIDNELDDYYFKEEQAKKREEAELIYWINR